MKVISVLLALALCGTAPLALAQATGAKPAAKPPAKPAATTSNPNPDGKTLAIGGGAGTSGGTGAGPLLSREELRACLNEEESIRVRLADQDTARVPLDQEKQAIATEQQQLRLDRAPIDATKVKAEELAAKMKAFAVRVQGWNERVALHNADKNPGTPAYDRNMVTLNREREEMQKDRTALEIERTALSTGAQDAVRTYNAKAAALDARVTAWNERNAKWNENLAVLEDERKLWVKTCADRRYREDDETAIKRGDK